MAIERLSRSGSRAGGVNCAWDIPLPNLGRPAYFSTANKYLSLTPQISGRRRPEFSDAGLEVSDLSTCDKDGQLVVMPGISRAGSDAGK